MRASLRRAGIAQTVPQANPQIRGISRQLHSSAGNRLRATKGWSVLQNRALSNHEATEKAPRDRVPDEIDVTFLDWFLSLSPIGRLEMNNNAARELTELRQAAEASARNA